MREVTNITKKQREAAERAMLKHLIDTKPEYKKALDALIDNPNSELKDIIQPVIESELKKARMIGVEIGFQAAMIQAYEKVKDMNNVDEIKIRLRNEVDGVRKRMGLNSAFDEDGNLITDTDDSEN